MQRKLLKRNTKIYKSKEKTFSFFFGFVLLFTFFFSPFFSIAPKAYAAINKEINYQGKLTLASGVAVPNTNYSIVFSLYTAPTGGTAIWSETRTVTTANGLFSEMLGDGASPLTSVNFNQTLYLGVKIENDAEMTPRKKLGVVPAAVVAETVTEAAQTNITSVGILTGLTMGGTLVMNANPISFDNSGVRSWGMGVNTGNFNFYSGDSLGDLTFNGNKIWNAGNDGTTSLLDADFLDGHDTAYFQTALTNPVTGTGTTNYLPKFTGTSALGNSLIYDDGTNIGIGTTAPEAKLVVNAGGTVPSLGAFASQTGFVLSKTSVTSDINRLMIIAGSTGSTGSSEINFGDADDLDIGGISYNHNLDILVFRTNNSSNTVINNIGNVGIGNTNPTSRLQIAGTTGQYPTVRIGSGTGALHYNGTTDASVLIQGTDGDRAQLEMLSPNGTAGMLMQAVNDLGFFLQSRGGDFIIDQDFSGGSNMKITGSSGTRGIMFASSYTAAADAGIFRASAGKLSVTGNVGIGTTNPTSALEVAGQIKITGGSPGSNKVLVSDADGLSSWSALSGLSIGNADTVDNYHVSGTTNYISKYTDGTHLGNSSIFDNGNIGIGTTAPGSILQVGAANTLGTFIVDNSSNPGFGIYNNGYYGIQTDISVLKSGWSGAIGGYYNGMGIKGSTSTGTNPIFGVLNSAQSGSGLGSTALTIYDNNKVVTYNNTLDNGSGQAYFNGNVGIGTTAPGKKLEVAGSYKLGTNAYIQYDATYPYTISMLNTAGAGNLILNAGSGSAGFESKIELQGGNTATSASIMLTAASNPALTILNNGNVGIGTTNPVARLHSAVTANGYDVSLTYNTPAAAIIENWGVQLAMGVNTTGSQPFYLQARQSANTSWPLALNPLGGNVGIGTTGPSEKLDVSGAIRFTGQLTNLVANSGTLDVISGVTRLIATGPNISTGGTLKLVTMSSNTGVYNEALTIISNGNVGIGTTGPGTKLQISDTYNYGLATNDVLSIRSTLSGGTTSNPSSLGGILWRGLSDTGTYARINAVADNLSVDSSSHMEFWTTNGGTFAERLRIDKGGNVGIGTTAPNARLDVIGDGTNNVFRVSSAPGLYRFRVDQSYGMYMTDSSGADTMVIKNDGSMGIGNTDPKAKLHVSGGKMGIVSTSNANGQFRVANTSDAEASMGFFTGLTESTFGDGTPASSHGWMIGPSVWGIGTNRFGIGNLADATPNLVIEEGGNVGIGTTDPAAKLHVVGNTYIQSGQLFVDTIGGYALAKVSIAANTDFIVPSGNVGIGTTGPTNKLHVLGSSNDIINSTNLNVKFEGGGGNGLGFGTIASSPYTSYIQSGYVTNFSSAVYNLALNPLGGNVGVGTTTPGTKLDVAGGAIRTDNQLISTIATGTSPLAVSSTTVVSNLNSDLLDGVHGSTYYKEGDVIMNTNPFGGRQLYINSVNDAFFRAADRWVVTGNYYNASNDSLVGAIPSGSLATLFDGDYESSLAIPAGQYAVINVNFSTESGGQFPGYPYGNFYLSNYYIYTLASATVRTYSNYAPHGIGWHSYTFSDFYDDGSYNISKARNDVYAISQAEFKIYAPSGAIAYITAIDYQLDRPGSNEMPLVDKYKANNLYSALNFKSNLTSTALINPAGVSYFNGGNVGIGTTDPKGRLNTLALAGVEKMTLGSATQPGLSVTSYDGNPYGMYFGVSTDGKSWIQGGRTDSATAYDISLQASGGNVGIGTATPGYALQVNSSLSSEPYIQAYFNSTMATGYGGIGLNGINQSHLRFFLNGTAKWQIRAGEGAGTDALSIYSWTKGENVMYFKNDGNVGIGTATPNAKLEIHQDSNADTELRIMGQASYDPRIFFKSEEGDGEGFKMWYDNSVGDTYFDNIYSQATQTIPAIRFRTNVSGTVNSLVDAMTILHNGNVGIGTTAPGTLLSLNSTSNNSTGGIRMQGNTVDFSNIWTQNIYSKWLHTESAADAAAGYGRIDFETNAASNPSSPTIGGFSFKTAGAGQFVTFTNTGNVGIGTTDPKGRLNTRALTAIDKMTLGSATQPGLSVTSYDGNPYGMYFGVNDNGNSWIQAGRTDSATAYNMSLQASGGNVGIGTTAPSDRLSIMDTVATGTVSIKLFSESDGGYYTKITNNYSYANPFSITVGGGGGGEVFGVYSTSTALGLVGKVGIGTNNPQAKLHVFGSAVSGNGTVQTLLVDGGTGHGAITINSVAGGYAYQTLALGGVPKFEVGINPSGDYYLNPNIQTGSAGAAIYVQKSTGNVGIGTTTPLSKLSINGGLHVGGDSDAGDNNLLVDGTFRVGELYYSGLQSIALPLGTESWVNLATIPNNGTVKFQIWTGSSNSEEIAEVKVFGTYHVTATGISVERQTYNEHLREVRVTGADGGNKTVYIKVRSSVYAPTVSWRVIESKGVVTINNVEATPTGGLALLVTGNLITSTNTGMAIAGNVGIGTISPLSKLNVQADSAGSAWGTGQLSISGATDSNKRLVIGYDTTNDLGFIQAGNNGVGYRKLILNAADGNVGIGTTSPAISLDFGGGLGIAYGNTSTPPTGLSYGMFGYSGVGLGFYSGAGGANQGIGFWTKNGSASPAESVRIIQNGNVGIGTTSPGANLEIVPYSPYTLQGQTEYMPSSVVVQTPIMTNDSYNSILQLVSRRYSLGTGNLSQGYLGFSTVDNSNAQGIRDAGRIAIVNEATNSRNSSTALSFWTNAGGTNTNVATEKMRITSTGNVGIGTTAPTDITGAVSKLEVSGTTETHIIVSDTSDSNMGLVLANRADGNSWLMSHRSVNNRLGFYYNNGTTWSSELLTVLNSGNVGIGTVDPLTKLDVAGKGLFGDVVSGRGGNLGTLSLQNVGNTETSIHMWQSGVASGVIGFPANNSNLYIVNSYDDGLITDPHGIVIDTTGEVGIGTTGPTALLDIKTAAGFTRGMRIGPQNGNLDQGGYIEFNSSATDGYGAQIGGIRTGASGENALVFRTGTNAQTEKMRITNAGYVGIGRVDPNLKLDIYTTLNTGDGLAIGQDTDNTQTIQAYIDTNVGGGWANRATYAGGCCNGLKLQPDVGYVQIGTGWQVDHVGNMTGVGTIASGAITATNLIITSGSISDSDTAYVTFADGIYSNTGTSYFDGLVNNRGGIGNDNAAYLTINGGTGSDIYMNGNVGIGVTDPTVKLDISGAIKLTGHIQMTNERVYWDNYISAGLGSNYGYDVYTPNAAFTGSTVKLHVGGYNATSSYFTSGYVGIGITDPNYVLEVRGSSVSSNSDRSVVTAISSSGTYGVIGTLTASPLWIYASGSNVVSVDGSSMTGIGIDVCSYSGSYCLSTVSDERLKDNVFEMGTVLDRVMKLRPITYTWNDTYLQTHPAASKSFTNMGFIAQEIKEVFPEVVIGNETESTYLGVDYAHMTPILTMAIQEMNLRLGVLTGEVIPLDGSKEKEFETKFFANVFTKVGEWLGSAENGIKTIFARKISTRLLCIADEAGVETCVEKSQLDGLLARAGSASASDANNTGGGVNTEEDTNTEINPEAPVIEIIGEGTINLNIGDSYEEAGANATDNKDDFVAVDISGVPDTSKDGIYAIHYNAVDTDGNNAVEVIRKIIVGTGVYVVTEVSMDASEGDTSISGTLPEAGETTTITETGGSDDSSAGASTSDTTTDTTTTTTVSTGIDSGAVTSGDTEAAGVASESEPAPESTNP